MKKRKVRNASIRAMADDGVPLGEIVSRFGLSRQRVYQIIHPRRARAHRAVGVAVRSGRLSRPSTCTECGAEGPIEAHHPDYDKPLDVEWLCVPCHVQADARDGFGRGGTDPAMVAMAARVSPAKAELVESIGAERGHKTKSETMREVVDEYIASHVRG